MILRTFPYTAIFIMLWFQPAVAQEQDQNMKFRLAQTYEAGGDFASAATLYRELRVVEPGNSAILDGLGRMYLQLKQYDSAAVLLRDRLRTNTRDVAMIGRLGTVYYKWGKEKEALAEWENAVAVDPHNATVYRIVGNIMLENRLLDRAADLYRRGRNECGDPHLFTLDLAQLLSASMDYAGATKEFLAWLEANPTQLAYVEGRMSTFTGKPEARRQVIDAIRVQVDTSPQPRLYELLGWVYMEGKQYAEALEAYRRLDALSSLRGSQIYAFAERAYREGAYDVAAKAFQEAIDVPVPPARLPYARYGYANALMQIGNLSDTVSGTPLLSSFPATEAQPRYAGAIASFRAIIHDYPATEFSAKSYYQIGTIQFRQLFDLDGALASFRKAGEEFPDVPVLRFDVALKIGAVSLAKGDTSSAAERFREVYNAPSATPDQQDEAAFDLARVGYFAGRFEPATRLLGELSVNLKADFANDALGLLAFLQENTATSADALREYAQGDFLAAQRRNTEAIAVFNDVITRYPQALLVDDAMMTIARLQSQAGRFADAIATYETLIDRFRETSIATDKARFGIAELYQFGLKKPAQAISAYEQVLTDYPSSLLVAEARRRIRALRGDTL